MRLETEQLGLRAGQSVYISPFTPMSEKLKRHLVEHSEVAILGFVDKSKQGEDIIHPEQLAGRQFDKVLIISPNYGLEIFKGLKHSGIAKSKLQLVVYNGIFNRISAFKLWWEKTKDNALPQVQLFLQRYVQKHLQRDDCVLFLSQDFIDVNIKQLYLYFAKQTQVKSLIATDNRAQIMSLRQAGFKVIPIKSFRFVFYSLQAKLKILDHTPISNDLRIALHGSKTIQIWHGIPLKKIGHLANYNVAQYDLMVSTSDFVTDYAFSNVFNYKNVINAGYPRNDIFFSQSDNSKHLAMVEQSLYQWLSREDKKVVVYMPTWRSDADNNNPVDVEYLNAFAKENELIIVIKMHPFIRPDTFFESIEVDHYLFKPDYQHNVVFYPSINDIYPILALSSLLITDYSSIYFDYLLVDKPILFFVYDKEAYIKRHGDFMLDFDQYTPGLKPVDMPGLLDGILVSLKQDEFQNQRQQLIQQLYDEKNIGRSSAVIFEQAVKLLAS